MKVVVAIDSFKGSMTSMQAGNACKEGILAAARAHCDGGAAAVRDRKPAADNMDVVVKPLADGGEGTVEALVEGMNGTYEYVTVTGPMGNQVKARRFMEVRTRHAPVPQESMINPTLPITEAFSISPALLIRTLLSFSV